MSSICKLKISGDNYDISPSPTGTLNGSGFTSNDAAQSLATSYTAVDPITTSDTNATIFSKITNMIKNIRFLYNKIGTTDISSIGNSLTESISNISNRHNNVENGVLLASDWSSNEQTLSSSIVTSSNTFILVPQSIDHFTFGISISSRSNGSVTFSCTSTPSNDIPIQIITLI